MTDLIGTGVAWLDSVRKASLVRTITYCRGDDQVEIDATPGRREFATDDESPVAVEHEVRDYIFSAADLVLDGSATLPVEGDQVVDTIGGIDKTYEVMPWQMSGQPYQLSGPNQSILRVHTKLVDDGS